MKNIYLLISLSFIANVLLAQTNEHTIKFGIKGGVNFASVALTGNDVTQNIKDGISNTTSFYFGGFAQLPLNNFFSLQSGFSLTGKGSKTDVDVNVNAPFMGMVPVNYKRETNIMYLEVPFNLVFSFKNFYLGTGPYVAYAIAGKEKSRVTSNNPIANVFLPTPIDGNVKFGDKAGEITPFDFGANILLGYQLKNGFNVSANYGLGIGKANLGVLGFSDIKASNRVLSVLVGFMF